MVSLEPVTRADVYFIINSPGGLGLLDWIFQEDLFYDYKIITLSPGRNDFKQHGMSGREPQRKREIAHPSFHFGIKTFF